MVWVGFGLHTMILRFLLETSENVPRREFPGVFLVPNDILGT